MALEDTKFEIKHTEVVDKFLLLKWTDNSETVISLNVLRKNCPCASCSGEKDVLGNVFKGPTQKMSKNSYRLVSINPVGYYGICPVWGDGHKTGIFTFNYLKSLNDG
jgi:DUF971 family protein